MPLWPRGEGQLAPTALCSVQLMLLLSCVPCSAEPAAAYTAAAVLSGVCHSDACVAGVWGEVAGVLAA